MLIASDCHAVPVQNNLELASHRLFMVNHHQGWQPLGASGVLLGTKGGVGCRSKSQLQLNTQSHSFHYYFRKGHTHHEWELAIYDRIMSCNSAPASWEARTFTGLRLYTGVGG